MKKILESILVLILFAACHDHNNLKQDGRIVKNETEKNIYRCADSMVTAFKRKDWSTFVRYNQPNMTSMMGGPQAFASFVNMQMKQIPDSAAIDISVGKILQIVKTHTDEQCVVEQRLEMKMRGTTVKKTTYLVGESLDNGGHWTFFDASTKTALSAKDIKPNISPQLIIPAAKKDIE